LLFAHGFSVPIVVFSRPGLMRFDFVELRPAPTPSTPGAVALWARAVRSLGARRRINHDVEVYDSRFPTINPGKASMAEIRIQTAESGFHPLEEALQQILVSVGKWRFSESVTSFGSCWQAIDNGVSRMCRLVRDNWGAALETLSEGEGFPCLDAYIRQKSGTGRADEVEAPGELPVIP
jgi:hypothetical protein